MQLEGMRPEPATPDEMVGPSGRDDRPERRAVTEHPEMGELVNDNRVERVRRREDEPPAEHQPTLTRRAAPARSRIADRDRCQPDAERGRVVADRRLDRDRGLRPEPSLEDAVDVVAIANGEADMELEVGRRHHSGNGRSSRCALDDPKAMEVASEANRGPVGEPAPSGEL